MNPSEKAAITRRANLLSKLISQYRADRGLWENMDPDGLARNKRFLANIEEELRRLMRRRADTSGVH